jgi:predicted secreted protein
MSLFTNFLLFVLVWWVTFFIFLPIKISIPLQIDRGHATSAPQKTYIGIKVVITTSISAIIMLFLFIIKFDLGMMFKQ